MAIKRITTGIPGFDALIGGGFKEKSVNLIAGGPGTGKTMFAVQFLLEGLKNGEAGIYITFEEKKMNIYEDMLELGWDLEKYEKQGKFTFLEYTPNQVKKILTEGGGIVESIIEKTKASRLVIDSITSFTLLYGDELTKKEAALALFELISKWKCTGLMTSQDLSRDEMAISAALEFEVDGIILAYHVRIAGERVRGIEILKMRGTKTPEKTFSLELSNKGVKVNTKKIVRF